MENLKLLFILLLFCSFHSANSQIAKLELLDCRKLDASFQGPYDDYKNFNFVLEQKNADNNWKKYQALNSYHTNQNFLVKETGIFRVVIFPINRIGERSIATKFSKATENAEGSNSFISNELIIRSEDVRAYCDNDKDSDVHVFFDQDSKELFIQGPDDSREYFIYDVSGRLLHFNSFVSSTHKELSSLISGMYFVVVSNELESFTQKFIVH